LYGGDRETRIQQEIILGIGGVRALKAMGSSPRVWHLNEGHAAFVVLQRIRDQIEHGSSFESAVEEVRRTTIFTTHTPVPAGHDAFPFNLVETHLAGAWGTLGEYRDAFLALGHYDNGSGPLFNMTALALRTASRVNGVSQLHGNVTREMWGPIWPGVADDKRPVRAITNGVHVPTWLSYELSTLFDQHLDSDWRERHDDPAVWERILEIPDEELWQARNALRNYLFAFIRERARQRWKEEHVSAARVVAAGTLLDPNALTIGFARRFTGYKRPELIFQNPDRLVSILTAARRPVQIVFAGKAHPADETGKHHLQRVYRRAVDPMFAGRIAFVDDYDLHVAHFLVQGCDVWLNNPRKPLEASGTSGMKASVNGVPHLSIADGWWAEGYTGRNGWVIEGRPASTDQEAVDAADAAALYRILEEEVVPTFYDRDPQGVPRRWLSIVRQAILSVAPRFSARRMVREYAEDMYVPAMQRVADAVKLP
jgi:starch phosphorylase